MTTRPEPASSPAATPAAPPAESLVGSRVHKYDIVRVIGRGGMGTVYEALNTAIGKRVAMKFIDRDTASNADAVARFQREAQAASAVESAHIVDIFDSGISEDGLPYIVMELLRGEDLGHRIKRCGRLDLGEAVHVTAQILRGLHRAHKAGIVHRDLKPDNIFLVDRDDDPNFAKVLDFGISKMRRGGETPVHTLTRQGTVLGTPFYMSPEQAQAQPDVDARSDLWSVGAILYECLTGRPPYNGTTYEQVIVNICMNDAEDVRLYNPAVPEPVANVLAKALSRDREHRFRDAREFLDSLRAASGGLISSRGGALSDDSFPGSSDPALMPISSKSASTGSGRRRITPPVDPALDATVQHPSTPPERRSGARLESLTGRRRAQAARERRMFFIVASSALFAGGLGAFLFARMWAKPQIVQAQTRTVESVILQAPPPASAPAVTPVETAAATATGDPTPPSDTSEPRSKTPKSTSTHVVATPPPATSAKTPPPTTTVKPADTATAPSGVAPGLKIKTD
jgi:serine/threonine-protein kinase